MTMSGKSKVAQDTNTVNSVDSVNYGNYARGVNYGPVFAGGDTGKDRQDIDNDNNNDNNNDNK